MARLAPGFEPGFSWPAFLVALLASAAWAALVVWRVGRHRHALWKSVVLPAGGAALGWLLLMTLWLPLLDYARSDVPITANVARLIAPGACAHTWGLGRSELAALDHHAGVRPVRLATDGSDGKRCPWLIVATDAQHSLAGQVDLQRWEPVSTLRHPTERSDRWLVLRRR